LGGGTHGIRYAPAVSDVVVDAGPARVQSYDSVAVLSVGVLSVAVLSVGVVRPGRSTADHQPHRHGQLAASAPENDAPRRPRGPRRVAAQTTRQGPCVVFHIYVRERIPETALQSSPRNFYAWRRCVLPALEVTLLLYTAHKFNGPLSGTTRVSRYRKGKNQSRFN